MSYTKYREDWKDGLAGGTAMSSDAFDHMEAGIAAAHDLVAEKADAVHTHVSADVTDATPFNDVDTIVKRDNEGGIAVTRVTGLSTATNATHAVPKSQLDSGLAGKADSTHTHVLADVTDLSTVGTSLATATDAQAALDVLGADSSGDVDTKVAAAVTTASGDATAKADTAVLTANSYTDTAVDYAPIELDFAVGSIPVRPDTSSTNRKVHWTGEAAAALPTNGTVSGGTAAAAPGDKIFEF